MAIGVNAICCYYLCRVLKPKIVVETGVLSGRSTTMILQALSDNNDGKLFSLDLGREKFEQKVENEKNLKTGQKIKHLSSNEKASFLISIPRNKNIGWLIPERLKKRWKLILGDSRLELPKLLEELRNVDIFIHDSDHTYDHMMFEFQTAWPFLNHEGVLCSDDVSYNNSWLDFAKEKRTNQSIINETFGIMKKESSLETLFD